MSAAEREDAVAREVLAGNVPDFERRLVAVALEATSPSGRSLHGTVFVLPDYLAIGTDEDFVRIPLTIRMARGIARDLRCVLPTPHLVDRIHEAAIVKLTSPRLGPGDRMGTMDYFARHNALIEARRDAVDVAVGRLVSGPKKDLVITRRMLEIPGRTAIYGWFSGDGEAIQPLSLVHDDRYVDYAHGVRFVDETMLVGGEERSILDVLADPEAAPLLSDEGAFDLRVLWSRGW